MERTIQDLGDFIEAHNIVNLRVQKPTKGDWEVNWQERGKARKQVSNADFALAISSFMQEVDDASQ